MNLRPALELHNIARVYGTGENALQIFKDLSLTIVPGEIVGLIGPSGAGKSSLLHIAGLLEKPTAGEVVIAGQNCNTLDDAARTRIRRIGIRSAQNRDRTQIGANRQRAKCHGE